MLTDEEWLWIATDQGLIRLNQHSLDYELFTHTGTSPDVSLVHVYTMVVDDQGRLWAGGRHGLVRYSRAGEWELIYTDKEIYQFGLDTSGNLWYFVYGGRMPSVAFRFQGQEPPANQDWIPEQVPWPRDSLQEKSGWRFLTVYRGDREITDGEDNTWSYTYSDAYSVEEIVIHRNNSVVQRLPLSVGLVNGIVAGNPIGIWLGMKNGLFYSDGERAILYQLTTDQTMVGYALVRSFAFTGDGSSWASTSAGLLHLNEDKSNTWENVTEESQQIPIQKSYLITPDQQNGLWVSGDGYLAHFNGQRWQRRPIPADTLQNSTQLRAIVTFQNALWVIDDKYNLWRFDGEAWAELNISPGISDLVKEGDERLYAIEKRGPILVYDGQAWERLPDCGLCGAYASPHLSAYAVNGIWIVFDSGIWRYSKDAGWCKMVIPPKQYGPIPASDFYPVTAILIDTRGDLWLANDFEEVLHCGHDQKNCELWDFAGDTGLKPVITTIAEDLHGRIWVGGWGLLSVYDPAAKR